MSPLAQTSGSFWMPPQGSSAAGEVDAIFYIIYWISVFFFALIVGLMAWFVIRYRSRGPADAAGASPSHNLALEVTWTAIPIVVSAAIFALGFKSFMNIVTPPAGAYEIQVTGQKWQWFFTYPNGHVSEELHVPVERPVTLVMTSEDVIHSMFIPAFRVKKDVVPGRYSHVWFEAKTPGNYPVLCTEYCGTGHSDMLTTVTVHEPGMFDRWLVENSNIFASLPPAQAGEMLIRKRGCLQCHTLDGSALVGPTFKNVFGHDVAMRGGGRVTADEDYIRQSILEPMAQVVAGFDPVMPTYAGKLKDQEISAIIAYLKTLSDGHLDDEPADADVEGAHDPGKEL